MHGHQALVSMRLKGYTPDCVFIDTDEPNAVDQATGWAGDNPAHAHIQTAAGERIDRLDMRCVHGMQVRVTGMQKARVRDMRDACIEAGAARVIASVIEQIGSGHHITFRPVETTDTEGVIVWPPVEITELSHA